MSTNQSMNRPWRHACQTVGAIDDASASPKWGVERPATSLRDQLDWAQISSALATLREKLRASWPESGNVEVFVAGFAPLSVFFAVGAILDTRVARVTCLQPLRHQSNEWTTLELSAGTGPDVLSTSGASGEPAESTGHVGVYLSTLGLRHRKSRCALQSRRRGMRWQASQRCSHHHASR
jgi:hypothetical protein